MARINVRAYCVYSGGYRLYFLFPRRDQRHHAKGMAFGSTRKQAVFSTVDFKTKSAPNSSEYDFRNGGLPWQKPIGGRLCK